MATFVVVVVFGLFLFVCLLGAVAVLLPILFLKHVLFQFYAMYRNVVIMVTTI